MIFFGMGKAWVVFRHDDAFRILKDNRFLKDMRKFKPKQIEQENLGENASVSVLVEWLKNMPNMLTVDPPDHTRLRRLVSKAFTPRMIEDLHPRVQEIADELLDSVLYKRKMDLIEDFAYPLPILVISDTQVLQTRQGKIKTIVYFPIKIPVIWNISGNCG